MKQNYTTQQLNEIVQLTHPYLYRNNRGSAKTGNGYITYGIPNPPKGRKEEEHELKGGDWVGFTVINKKAIFTSIETKSKTDRIKQGQVNWHNFVLENGGISEIWKHDGKKITWKTTKEEVNLR